MKSQKQIRPSRPKTDDEQLSGYYDLSSELLRLKLEINEETAPFAVANDKERAKLVDAITLLRHFCEANICVIEEQIEVTKGEENE